MSFACIQHCHCKLTGFDLVLYFIHISKKKKVQKFVELYGRPLCLEG